MSESINTAAAMLKGVLDVFSAELARRDAKIEIMQARLDLLEPVYEAARCGRTAPNRREADVNLADLGPAVDTVLEAERTGRSACLASSASEPQIDGALHVFQRLERQGPCFELVSGRQVVGVQVATRCRCGWQSGWFTVELGDAERAARDFLQQHISSLEEPA